MYIYGGGLLIKPKVMMDNQYKSQSMIKYEKAQKT